MVVVFEFLGPGQVISKSKGVVLVLSGYGSFGGAAVLTKQLASIAQLGERKTEDLKVPCSIHGRSKPSHVLCETLFLFRVSIVASIPACHAGDRGSIPRRGERVLSAPYLDR